ncbi:MAG: hypothetical protein A3H96_06230 [Acidobacteria bacterium RIFCSPLOWO2_02_FULL_67_36]|nr:MAG: hypothetical protein A3H96_06230 [Acidobacteria bacterium RIFCSPLOWO2_02_FULL_67_36]OFW20232.1 MAG: hypothetical protein A3G21_26540 [Acidobacteria bacterium RIFCSPLOWO2_12_FULL_66_21]
MADDRTRDTSDYSSSKAPETRAHARERAGSYSDWRLIPGGRSGSEVSVGMDSIDRESVPSQAAGHTKAG